MPKTVISEDLILLDLDGDSQTAEDVIVSLCERMVQEGYVDSTYCQAVLDRERQFPTGLPMLPYPVAIPHAAADGVKKTGIAVAIMNHSVPFRSMGSPDEYLDVRIVVLLAIADHSKQVSVLQWLCGGLQGQGVLKALLSASSSREVLSIFDELRMSES